MSENQPAERPFSEHRQQVEATLAPASTAVIVVDMINEFLEDGGLMVLASGRALYGPIQQLVDAVNGAVPGDVILVADGKDLKFSVAGG